MIYPKIRKIARQNGWHRTKDAVFGLYKDYFFTMGDGYGFKFITAVIPETDDEKIAQIGGVLEKNRKILGFYELMFEERTITVTFKESFAPTKESVLYEMLEFFVQIFDSLNFPKQNCCDLCSSKNNFDYYTYQQQPVMLCKSCHTEFVNDINASIAEFQTEEKNYLQGIFGAIVFSLPGVVLWVILSVYIGIISALMAVVFTFLAIKGYEKFGAKWGRLTPLLLILVNIVLVIISNYASVIYTLFISDYGINLQILRSPEMTEFLTKHILFSLLVCSLAWVYFLFQMWKGFKSPKIEPAKPA